jgi:hydroxymethylglutaryl-CoA lyase
MQPRGAVMGDDRPRPTGEDCGPLAGVRGAQAGGHERVDALVHTVQTTPGDCPGDRPRPQVEVEELLVGDGRRLSLGDPCDRQVGPGTPVSADVVERSHPHQSPSGAGFHPPSDQLGRGSCAYAPPMAGLDPLPERVVIREVGPRDGFQNEPDQIPTDDKVRLIDALSHTGLRRIEVTSFVRAEVVPQLADAAEVLARIDVPDAVAVAVLVPNERGLNAALEHAGRIDEVALFLSASETHNRHNVNRSVDDSLTALTELLPRIAAAGLRPSASISTAFGCPYEGHVAPERVYAIASQLAEAGAQEISFGDTTGMANPRQVRSFYDDALRRLPGIELTAHFHNTRGQGLANSLAALEAGVTSFESSFGELGGCPFPPGATGNIATEDLVSMLHEMGVATGIDLDALLQAGRDVQRVLGRPLGSHLLTAGPVVWNG